MAKRTLADLLVKLSIDPALRRRFRQDPVAMKDEIGLSDEELELLSGGKSDQIRDALGGDTTVNSFIIFVDDESGG